MERIKNRSRIKSSIFAENAATVKVIIPTDTRKSNKMALALDYLFWVTVAIVLLRFSFKLIGANVQNPLVTIINNFTNPVVSMFHYLIPDVVSGNAVIEISSLAAIVAIWFVYRIVIRLVTAKR